MTPTRAILLSLGVLPALMAATTVQQQPAKAPPDRGQPARPAATGAQQPAPLSAPRPQASTPADAVAPAVRANSRPCNFSKRRTDDCPA